MSAGKKVNSGVYALIREHKEIGCMDNPEFLKTRKCHDWRNYVPDEIVKVWADLSMEARIMVYLTAQKPAMAENWDRFER